MTWLAGFDLDGDGVPESWQGYNGGGGVRSSTPPGGHVCDRTTLTSARQIVDTDGDGKPEIVHSNAAGR